MYNVVMQNSISVTDYLNTIADHNGKLGLIGLNSFFRANKADFRLFQKPGNSEEPAKAAMAYVLQFPDGNNLIKGHD